MTIAPIMVPPSKFPQLKPEAEVRREIVISGNDGAEPQLRSAPSLRPVGEQSQSHAAAPFIVSPLSK